jgi:hypothetical protein
MSAFIAGFMPKERGAALPGCFCCPWPMDIAKDLRDLFLDKYLTSCHHQSLVFSQSGSAVEGYIPFSSS